MMKGEEGVSMRISLLDRSLYYKSLMILIRKDRQIHDEEKKLMLSIGKMLGFDLKFCTKTMEELLDNNHIVDALPRFSGTDIALCFIRDGLRMSASDGQIHEAEVKWLESVAESNGLRHLWIAELEKLSRASHGHPYNSLELRNFEWE
ncbi:MAG: hypothetical protein FD159_139 [Syntrophaceae bacterium]|nr:MAG: hypothetical protein FD159_139 [Syntrophaceae bacterium]